MVRLTVVNDSPELLDLFADIFASDRYETTLIEHVTDELLAKICASEPDLLMIDLRHEGDAHHGWKVVQALRATPGCERLPVVLCTADISAPEDLQLPLESMPGIVLLTLPFQIDALVHSIHTLIGRQEVFRCS